MEGAHTRRDSLFLKSACLCFSFSHRSSSFSISSLSRIVTRSILYIIDILSNHMNINIASVSYFLTKTGFSRGPVSSSESEYSSYSEDSSLSLCSASSTTSSISWRDQNRTSIYRHHSQTTNFPIFFFRDNTLTSSSALFFAFSRIMALLRSMASSSSSSPSLMRRSHDHHMI